MTNCSFTRVTFHHFKAFRTFDISLRRVNILVGPNNSGKSTILTAFRILAAAMRKAEAKRPELVPMPGGPVLGYSVDLGAIAVADENIFYNYDDSEPAHVVFHLSNKNRLELHFPKRETCYLQAICNNGVVETTTRFKKEFDCPIGFVPILGPVEHREILFQKDAARLALFSYGAARNFRNIWYHYGDHFAEFRELLQRTWPGMNIEPPKVDFTHDKARLFMFCPEERIPREIAWAGFGFQVWCQMLTHIVQSRTKSLFLIDEPDIYLHPDLQRQLLGLLKDMGPDLILATHSTELIADADMDEIVLVNKNTIRAKRIRDPGEMAMVFRELGSSLNPILTQLAKTRRALFVEGKDFQILGRFARVLGRERVANRSHFAVVGVGGFNPDRIRTLKKGIEKALGEDIAAIAFLDRDYRCQAERDAIERECQKFCEAARVHDCKEVENFLLVPTAIDRAARSKVGERNRRTGSGVSYTDEARTILELFCAEQRANVMAQQLAERRRYVRDCRSGEADADIMQVAIADFEAAWATEMGRLAAISGKDAISYLNKYFQSKYSINITATAIVTAMRRDEVPTAIGELVDMLEAQGV